MESNYPDSVNSSPRSRETDSDYCGGSTNQRWEAVDPGGSSMGSSARVRLMCSCGGKILPRPHDNQLSYVGGDTRILAVDRSIRFSTMISKLSSVWGSGVSFKYQLPNEDLDALVSVTNDEDVDNMMLEYDRLQKSGYKNSRLRLFVFPVKPTSGSASSLGSVLEESKREQWFVDALNNPPVSQGISNRSDAGSVSEASAWANNMPDYLFGLENRPGGNNNGRMEEERKNALPEVQSMRISVDLGNNPGATQIGIGALPSDQAEKVGGNLNWGFEDNSASELGVNSSPVQGIGIQGSPSQFTNFHNQQQQQQEEYMKESFASAEAVNRRQKDVNLADNQSAQPQQEDYMQESFEAANMRQKDANLADNQRALAQQQQQRQEEYMQESSASAEAVNRRQKDLNLADVVNQRAPAQPQLPPQIPIQELRNMHLKQQQEDTQMNLPGRRMYYDPARGGNLAVQGQEFYLQQPSQAEYYRQDQQQQVTGHLVQQPVTYWQMPDHGGNAQYPVYLMPPGSNMMQPMAAGRPAPRYYNPVQRMTAAPAGYDAHVTTVRATAGVPRQQQQLPVGVSDGAADPFREQQGVSAAVAPPGSKVTAVYGTPAPLPVAALAGDGRTPYRAPTPVASMPVGVPNPESYPYTQQHVIYDPSMNATRQVYYTQAINPQYQPMAPVTTDVQGSPSSLDMAAAAAAAAVSPPSEQQVKLARVSPSP